MIEVLTPTRIAELRRLIHPQHSCVSIRSETLEALLDSAERLHASERLRIRAYEDSDEGMAEHEADCRLLGWNPEPPRVGPLTDFDKLMGSSP